MYILYLYCVNVKEHRVCVLEVYVDACDISSLVTFYSQVCVNACKWKHMYVLTYNASQHYVPVLPFTRICVHFTTESDYRWKYRYVLV